MWPASNEPLIDAENMSKTIWPARWSSATRRYRFATAGTLAIVLVAALGFGTAALRGRPRDIASLDSEQVRSLPRMNSASGFATSGQCQECHPEQYASWHASYHRQMTQVARPETVLAPFDGSRVSYAGQVHQMVQEGDALWVQSLRIPPEGERVDFARRHGRRPSAGEGTWQRVYMTTGAHYMQVYWTGDGHGNRLQELPVMYLRDPRPGMSRWAPLEASYLSPSPPGVEWNTHWNTDCILCHAAGGVPAVQADGATTTTVAELGITCESCHGPAEAHVREKRSITRANADGRVLWAAGRSVVTPSGLRPERAAQVCGHCHSAAVFTSQRLMEDFLLSGSAYRPGDDLLQTRVAVLPSRLTQEQNEAHQRSNPFFEGSYWPDGMIRVTGREYNGLVESTCYQRGGMTCLSCHSMHQSEPDDQLSAVGRGNEACYQCHAAYRDNLAKHTHHEAGSSGSQCYNCHMPHTTYGLFSAIRSHKISSPNVAVTLATGRPAACNLCHLDQTLEWTAKSLKSWYGHSLPELDEQQKSFAAAGLLLLKGDAAQRVITAWSTGWRPALEASGGDWLPPLLAPLLDDPSPVVRLVASRSLWAIDTRYTADFDYVAPSLERRTTIRSVLEKWRQISRERRERLPTRVFIKTGGDLNDEAVQRFLEERDDRGLFVQE